MPPESPTSRSIIGTVVGGPVVDLDQFATLYDVHFPDILAYHYRRTACAETAADLTSETFAIAFTRRRRFVDQGQPPVAWLYGIARNLLRGYVRRSRVSQRTIQKLGITLSDLSETDVAAILDRVDAGSPARRIEGALGTLSPDARRAVQLRVIEQLPYAEVAARMGCREATARVRVCRALKNLAEKLEDPTDG